MSKIVFVLGAGASVHCGTPLMGNFLEIAEALWKRGEVAAVSEDFRKVFEVIGNLQSIQGKARLDTYNIETIYAALEMGKLLGRLPATENLDEIDELISSIKKVIGYTLEKTTKIPELSNAAVTSSYSELALLIKSLSENQSCSMMTFNYDLGLDYRLYQSKILIDYGLADIDFSDKRHIGYFKLHGSLNWHKCTVCKKTVPFRDFSSTTQVLGQGYSTLPVVSEPHSINCCGKPLEQTPFIVPPTWNKTAFHEQIDKVWKRAAQELRDAEYVFVIGYSLPPSDLFFNYLFALGIDTKTILKGFYVYNTDQNVESRFRNLIGSGIEQRFHFFNLSFESALKPWVRDPQSIGMQTIKQALGI